MKYPPVIKVQFIHIEGPLKGNIDEFSAPKLLIGRDSSCQIRFPADYKIISRKHAELIREGNRFKLLDHSTNGTFVNGKKTAEAYLKDGDVIMFAPNGPKLSFLSKIMEGQIDTSYTQEQQQTSTEEKPASTSTPGPKETERPSIEKVKASLIVQYGPTLHSFNELPITIGKNPNCEFRLDHPSILDRHAQIFYSQANYWIKDLTGQGIIQINRKPVNIEEMLRQDSEIALSPQGPRFKFLGEGRIAEIEEPDAYDAKSAPAKETGGPGQPPYDEKEPKKGPVSFFKRFLK